MISRLARIAHKTTGRIPGTLGASSSADQQSANIQKGLKELGDWAKAHPKTVEKIKNGEVVMPAELEKEVEDDKKAKTYKTIAIVGGVVLVVGLGVLVAVKAKR